MAGPRIRGDVYMTMTDVAHAWMGPLRLRVPQDVKILAAAINEVRCRLYVPSPPASAFGGQSTRSASCQFDAV